MDRTGKIAVALALAVIIGWTLYQSSIAPPPKPAVAPSATPAVAGASPAQGATSTETVTPAAPAPTPEPEPALPEQTQVIKTPLIDYTFTNHGGGILRAQLNNQWVDNESKKNVVLNQYGPVPIGATSDKPNDGADASYTGTLVGTDGISYQRTTEQQIQFTKKFTLPTATQGVDQYLATLDLSIANMGKQNYNSDGYYVYLGAAGPIHRTDMTRYIAMDWYVNGKASEINVASFNGSNVPVLGHAERPEYPFPGVNTNFGDHIAWGAVYDQYFTSIVTPIAGPDGSLANRVWANRLPVDVDTHESGPAWFSSHPAGSVPALWAINGTIGMPPFSLKPGDTYTRQFKIYLGPREYRLLSQLDQGQDAVLRFGMFGIVSRTLLDMMNWLEKVVGSYAVAIIVLTVAIKLLLWPLQNRSTQSMKKMQALAPKIKTMQEKYKDDPAKLNQETIRLYKTYGINPVAGCLPMVIQLPIFFGFYSMLASAIELRNSKFLWVHDLSQPDTIGHFLGFPINILPLCMAATSAWMMSMTPKSGDSSQQKMMMFMPLLFLWICYNYASGLALYMMVSNLFSVVQFIVTKKTTAPTLEKVAVAGKKR